MAIINREAAEALIQEQLINVINQEAPKQSTFMALARKLPNMTSKSTRMMVLDMLPMAYWVNGDTGFKQTTQQAWDNVYMTAEELAVIVPIPEAVLDDASFDILGEVNPRIVEAIGVCVDGATIFGVNRPASWRADIITTARQAGNDVATNADIFTALLGEGGVFAKVEEAGYAVNGVLADLTMKAKLRGLKDSTGQPLFMSTLQGKTPYALDGVPMLFPENGAFDNTKALLIAGDFSKAVYSVRQDVTVKILDQGVIQDPGTKEIVYNLAQQDMIALRVVFRMGWALPNPATRLDGDRTSCPFAYYEPTTAMADYAVTFTVSDGASTGAVLYDGAVVTVDGVRKKTGANGKAVFNLGNGSYKYTVKKEGFATVTGTVAVSGAAKAEAVTLTAVV